LLIHPDLIMPLLRLPDYRPPPHQSASSFMAGFDTKE
jgi:hypothetical protein